ncbi:MAG: tetratricopeptide repeat protein [Chitinophagales bacterium]
MKTKFINPLVFCLLVVCAFCITVQPAFAQSKKKKDKKTKTASTKMDEGQEMKAQQLFFEGMTAKLKDDMKSAKAAFTEVLKLDPKNDAAIYELAKIYFDAQDKERSLEYAKQAAELDASNKWYQFLYAETLALNRNFENAAQVYEAMVKQDNNNYEYYFDWGYMLIKADKMEEAIKVYDLIESKVGITENVSLQKQRLYIQTGNLEGGIAELNKLITEFPKETRYYQLLAELYEQTGKADKAIEVYKKLAEASPENPLSQLAMADFYKKEGNEEKYLETLELALNNPELPIDLKAKIFYPYIEGIRKGADETEKKEAFRLMNIIKSVHEKESMTYALYGDLLSADNQREGALEAFRKSAELDKKRLEVWQQVLLLQFEMQKYDDLIQDSKLVMELFPNQPMSYYFNGLAQTQMKKYEKATKVLKRGAMISVGNPELRAQMYSMLGENYNTQEDYENSDKYFKKALEISPSNATVLNNFAYFLSVRNENLEEAETMSKKSNELEPNNSSFLDTYGWIMYQKGNYEDAKKWLEKSLKADDRESATTLEHLGDAFFKLGNIKEAVSNWEKAKAKGGGSELLEKKITDKKLYE